jgi:uncharacterized protein (TIGR03067 family)
MTSMALLDRMSLRASTTGLATLLVAATVAAMLVGGGAARALADDDASAAALKTIKGTWVSDEGIDSKWTFDGESLKASVNGLDYSCKVKVDPKAKPATIDLVIDEGPEDAKGKTSKCIYKLDGEKLILCVSLPGHDRPKEFEQAEGESFLFELKKEKAKDKEEKKKE